MEKHRHLEALLADEPPEPTGQFYCPESDVEMLEALNTEVS